MTLLIYFSYLLATLRSSVYRAKRHVAKKKLANEASRAGDEGRKGEAEAPPPLVPLVLTNLPY